FAAAYINDGGIRRRHSQRADRSDGLPIEDRRPHTAVVGALPDAAVGRGDVEHVRLSADARRGHGAAAAIWADHAPLEAGEHRRIELLGVRDRWSAGNDERCAEQCDAEARWHGGSGRGHGMETGEKKADNAGTSRARSTRRDGSAPSLITTDGANHERTSRSNRG